MKTKQTVPYKDADEAFTVWIDTPSKRRPHGDLFAELREAFLEGWAAHADVIREWDEQRQGPLPGWMRKS